MNRLALLLAFLCLITSSGYARGGRASGSHSGGSHAGTRARSTSRSTACASCARNSRGKIARSSAARHEFMRQSGYPHGRPGFVVDHVVPLKRGGDDSPFNMQWQTKADARAKDKIE